MHGSLLYLCYRWVSINLKIIIKACLLWHPSWVTSPGSLRPCVCQRLSVWRVELSLNENEWVRLCGHSVWISSIFSSLIYSTSSPSKRPALHIGGVLWLRRFGKLTLLVWLVARRKHCRPFLKSLPSAFPPKKNPLKECRMRRISSGLTAHL